jgi:hypothetical protein
MNSYSVLKDDVMSLIEPWKLAAVPPPPCRQRTLGRALVWATKRAHVMKSFAIFRMPWTDCDCSP